MKRPLTLLALLLLAALSTAAAAPATSPPVTSPAAPGGDADGRASAAGPAMRPQASAQTQSRAEVSLAVVVEEGERQIRATVRADGKPVENAAVKFLVERSFGELLLGTDKTLDDGTAAVRFPADLPGAPGGELRLIAEIQSPPEYASARATATVPAGVAAPPAEPVVPRALWSARPPLSLVYTIVALLAGVWVTYAYAVAQLLAIRRSARGQAGDAARRGTTARARPAHPSSPEPPE